MNALVKICGLSTVEQVNAALDAGADALGFVFAESVRQVTPAVASAISAVVPASVKRVAVMLHPSDKEWQDVLLGFRPDVLQSDAADFATLAVPDFIEQWPVYREGGSAPSSDGAYVYEGQRSGTGQAVDWSEAAKIARRGKMILAGGLAANNVAEAISVVRPFGVDVSSAVECAPGEKDTHLIREFVDAVRAVEKGR